MAWNGIFFNGVWSCGFDMNAAIGDIFDIAPSGSFSTSNTPFGSGYAWLTSNPSGKNLGVNLTTFIFGIRCYVPSLPAAAQTLFTLWDSTAGAAQVTLRVAADGSMRFYLGNGTGTPIGSASAAGLFPAATWTFLEVKVVIAASSGGSVELRVNGNTTPVITQGSVTTKSTANTWVSGLYLHNLSGINNCLFDDWYMLDTTGASPLDTFLGNIRIVSDVPSGAGAHTQFTPTNPTNVNYTNVGNIPANTAKYNSDGTPGDIDSYAYPTIGGAPVSVLFLNHWYRMELDTAGARTVVPACRSGGVDYFDSTAQTPSNGTYRLFNKPWTVNPTGGAAWTVSDAEAAELGVKINT